MTARRKNPGAASASGRYWPESEVRKMSTWRSTRASLRENGSLTPSTASTRRWRSVVGSGVSVRRVADTETVVRRLEYALCEGILDASGGEASKRIHSFS